jgi:F0F1-type ATP synthase assembly protein I
VHVSGSDDTKDDGTRHERATSDDVTVVSPVLAVEALRTLDRKGLAGTGLTVAVTLVTTLVTVIMAGAVIGGVAIALPWLLGGIVTTSVLGVIGVRNLRRNAARSAATAALEGSRATASLSNDVLEIRTTGYEGPWRFALGRGSRSMRMLPAARALRDDD